MSDKLNKPPWVEFYDYFMFFGIVIVIIILALGWVWIVEIGNIKSQINYNTPTEGKEYYRGVAGSGSMYPLLDKDVYPKIKTRNRELDPDEELHIGRVYIFRRNNTDGNVTHVIHRLLGIWDIHNETYYVFMGDNNGKVDDPVFREQVYEEMIGIRYE